MSEAGCQSFRAFFPYDLKQHSDPVNRRLHFAGTTLVNALLTTAIVQGQPKLLLLLPFATPTSGARRAGEAERRCLFRQSSGKSCQNARPD